MVQRVPGTRTHTHTLTRTHHTRARAQGTRLPCWRSTLVKSAQRVSQPGSPTSEQTGIRRARSWSGAEAVVGCVGAVGVGWVRCCRCSRQEGGGVGVEGVGWAGWRRRRFGRWKMEGGGARLGTKRASVNNTTTAGPESGCRDPLSGDGGRRDGRCSTAEIPYICVRHLNGHERE